MFFSPFGNFFIMCNANKIPVPPSRRSKFFLVSPPWPQAKKNPGPPDAGSKIKVVPLKVSGPPGRKLWTLPYYLHKKLHVLSLTVSNSTQYVNSVKCAIYFQLILGYLDLPHLHGIVLSVTTIEIEIVLYGNTYMGFKFNMKYKLIIKIVSVYAYSDDAIHSIRYKRWNDIINSLFPLNYHSPIYLAWNQEYIIFRGDFVFW